MRELAFGPRCSGRTTRLANEIIKDLEHHDHRVYVVAAKYFIADMVRDIIRSLNGDRMRVIPVSIESLNVLRGVDPRNIYFEHTAYEHANSRQLITIYEIEDYKERMIRGVP